MISKAEVIIDGVVHSTSTNISDDKIFFENIQHTLKKDIPYVVSIQVYANQVITGGATAGQTFRIQLAENAFQTNQQGSITTASNQEVNPSTQKIENGNDFIIQQAAVSFASGGSISSDLLSASLQDMFKFKMNKTGVGTVEVGDALNNTFIEFETTKTSNAVKIDQCELRDVSNSILATKVGPFNAANNGAASQFANLAAQDLANTAFVRFSENDFLPGKRLQGGGGVYTVYCNVTSVTPGQNASFQMSLTQNVSLALIDNDVSIMNQTSKFNGLPVTGVARSAVN